MKSLVQLTDGELYEKCRTFGSNARAWSRKFAALLPEVDRRKLYKKYKFYSIFEFAAKLAGMKHERVAQGLQDKPLLLEQMEDQGWTKLRVVASFATKENEKMLAEKVKDMSKPTLETFISELRKQNNKVVQILPGAAETDGAQTGTATLSRVFVRLLHSPKNELRLKELQRKLSQKNKAPVDLNEVLETLLDAYEKPAKKKNALSATALQEKFQKLEERAPYESAPRRYIPADIKNFLTAKTGGRCAYPDCNKLPEIFHHTRRFAIVPDHNPDFLAPLCKEHERLAHHGLIDNEESAPEHWLVKTESNQNGAKWKIDEKVNGLRTASANSE